jgi:hypothetical protein
MVTVLAAAAYGLGQVQPQDSQAPGAGVSQGVPSSTVYMHVHQGRPWAAARTCAASEQRYFPPQHNGWRGLAVCTSPHRRRAEDTYLPSALLLAPQVFTGLHHDMQGAGLGGGYGWLPKGWLGGLVCRGTSPDHLVPCVVAER